MSGYTGNINLFKVDPVTDGSDTFNIDTMMNDNWDKIDAAIGEVNEGIAGLEDGKAPNDHSSTSTEYGAASTTLYGHTKLYSGTDSDSESLAATPKAVKAVATVAAAKADRVTGATAGNMAVLTSDGGVADGGLKFSIVDGGLRVTYDDGL